MVIECGYAYVRDFGSSEWIKKPEARSKNMRAERMKMLRRNELERTVT